MKPKFKQEKTVTIKYVDNQSNHRQFQCTKDMLQQHKQLMSNNPFIKSYEVIL